MIFYLTLQVGNGVSKEKIIIFTSESLKNCHEKKAIRDEHSKRNSKYDAIILPQLYQTEFAVTILVATDILLQLEVRSKQMLLKMSVRHIHHESLLFREHTKYFTDDEISILRSSGHTRTDDSTFVLMSKRNIYKNQLHRLKLTGKSRSKVENQKISSNKMKVLKDIFSDRLDGIKLEQNE